MKEVDYRLINEQLLFQLKKKQQTLGLKEKRMDENIRKLQLENEIKHQKIVLLETQIQTLRSIQRNTKFPFLDQ